MSHLSISIEDTKINLTRQTVNNIKKLVPTDSIFLNSENNSNYELSIIELNQKYKLKLSFDMFTTFYDRFCISELLKIIYKLNIIIPDWFIDINNASAFFNSIDKIFRCSLFKTEAQRIFYFFKLNKTDGENVFTVENFNELNDEFKENIKRNQFEVKIKIESLNSKPKNKVCTVFIETRLHLEQPEIETIAKFICNQYIHSPETEFHACMQVDTHCTRDGINSPWIGMSLSLPSTKIPIQIVSADIGCGLSVFPYLNKQSDSYVHANINHYNSSELQQLKRKFLLSSRLNLARGKKAEEGKTPVDISQFFGQCNRFLNGLDGIMEIEQYATNLYNLLTTLNFELDKDDTVITIPSYSRTGKGIVLDINQSKALRYVFGYMCSLGSSGNHFAELGHDLTSGQLYTIIHSGSRGIGAKIFDELNSICLITNGCALATNHIAELYTQAYDILQQLAFYNRLMCVMSIYNNEGIDAMRDIAYNSDMLSEVSDPNIRLNLIKGMVHNGLSGFVDHTKKHVCIVLKKGSIAMSGGAGIGFVALKPKMGCVAFIKNDPKISYREIPMSEALQLIQNDGYTLINLNDTDGQVATYGHGAGRLQSTTKSSKLINHENIMGDATEFGYVCNCGPGIYGDGNTAYRDVSLDVYGKCRQIKTLVSYKECIISFDQSLIKKFTQACIDIFQKYSNRLDNYKEFTDIEINEILSLDLILIKNKFEYKPEQYYTEILGQYNELCSLQVNIINHLFPDSRMYHPALVQ